MIVIDLIQLFTLCGLILELCYISLKKCFVVSFWSGSSSSLSNAMFPNFWSFAFSFSGML